MLNPDQLKTAQSSLAAQVKAYAYEKREEIAKIDAEVRQRGATGAVSTAAITENALIVSRSEGLFLEATNRGDDKAPINFLERGRRASRAVCRIVDGNRTPLGTGFLIGPGLLMTNNHVLPSASDAVGGWAEFDYEEDADERALPVQHFALRPETLFVGSPEDRLDFAILSVADSSRDGAPLAPRGWLPLDERRNKIFEGQPIVIIQHPLGGLKQICLFDSVLKFRDENGPYILYTTDTLDGSSGSPCFNRFWQLVALHHASVETEERDENGRPVVQNRGIRISSIMDSLKNGTDVNDPVASAKVYGVLADPAVQKQGRPFAPLPAEPRPSSPSAIAANVLDDNMFSPEGRTIIRVREPATFLDNRKGYRPKFLGTGDKTVPLPKLPDWLKDDAAKLADGSHELKYQHFSIAVSMSRKLAIYTATNVDGAGLQALGRKDRNPDAPMPGTVTEAAADRWFFDPRIDRQYQLEPDLYDATDFDYGHLVRRLDPVWGPAGDVRTPRIANDDTFYMTNCAPHEVRFHRTRRGQEISWSTLEDLVLNAARRSKIKFSVFTGPVLDPRDPDIGGVKIPTAFWKIAAFVKDSKLKAFGYMLWQDDEVRTMARPDFEGLELLEKERPTPIREIARLTGLDFGPLFAADVTLA